MHCCQMHYFLDSHMEGLSRVKCVEAGPGEMGNVIGDKRRAPFSFLPDLFP